MPVLIVHYFYDVLDGQLSHLMCYPVIVPLFLVVDGGAEVCGREERLAVEGVLWQVAGDGHAVQGAALGPGPVLPAPPARGRGGQ